MESIRVALIGCGYVADFHLKAWHRIPYAKVVAVCDTNKKLAERTAEKWRIPKSYAAISDISDSKEIDLWDVCTPIQTHKDVATEAMGDGFDVLIEKPLTIASEDAKEIVSCQKSTGKRAGVIHNWLFEPPMVRARRLVKRQEIGEIMGVNMAILHPKTEPMTANKDHWSHKLPGGRFSEMLIHPIYLLRDLLGEISLQEVDVSKTGEYPWMKWDELYATFRSGAKLAGTYASFNASRYGILIDLFGQNGIVRMDIINATITLLPSREPKRLAKATDSGQQAMQLFASTLRNAVRIVSGRWFDGHEMCIRLFAESLINDTKPPVTLEEACEVVKVLETASRRIESKQSRAA